jgi:1-carboxybiuret hydrolase subunit AtzG-like
MTKKTLGKTSPTRNVTRKSPAKTEAAADAKRAAKPAKELAKTAGKAAVSKAAGRKSAAKPAALAAGDPLDAFITAAATTLALPVEPQWMPAIKANLEATFRLGALVTEFELSDEVEPAPVFGA